MNPMIEERLFINGELRAASGQKTYDNFNPATEEKIGVVADASAQDMDAAIEAARTAFDESDWTADPHFRARCLRQLHDALKKHADEIRPMLTMENGATEDTLQLAMFDTSLPCLTYCAHLAETYDWETDLGTGEEWGMPSRRTLIREPGGVAACITPWNVPMQVNLAKVAPALAAGCTVILKPAPDTPWAATLLGRLVAEETDIPAGVFNVVTTSDNAVAQRLSEDPRVDIVSFTGSTQTGRLLMASAAATIKRVFLELGGKSAHIICDDADLDTACFISAWSGTIQAGQGCAINTRLLVQRSVYDEVVEKLKSAIQSMTYGDPTDPGNHMGPQINAAQHAKILQLIEQGKAEGARLVTGGRRPPHLEKGYFIEPTLFADVDPDSTIAQEEIFGPVLCVIPFDTDDEAVAIANNSIYGLSGQVSSRNVERARAIARRVRTGTINVNGGVFYNPSAPFGGYKQSGNGREMGVLGLEEYTEVKLMAEDA